MSFWENNKGSIKSGGMSLLKGAGKATATVSKAGYGAYKNHQANKKNALVESEEAGQQTATIPAATYRDPHSFPPPPHHGADGRPQTTYSQQSSASSLYGQQPPAPTTYGQQPPAQTPYGQQPPAQTPYGQQPPAQTPYGQQPLAQTPYGQQPPAQTPYGQQPSAQTPYGQQPPAQTPYGQQPPAQTTYGQQPPAQTPYGQQPPAQTPYGQQPPAQTPYGQQPPAQTPYGQQPPAQTPYGQQPPAQTPYGQQPPAQTPYGQQPPAQTPYGQQPPAQTTYGQQPPAQTPYGQQPSAQTPYGQQPPAQTPYGQQPPAQTTYGQQPPAQTPYGQQPPAQTPYVGSSFSSENGQQSSTPLQYTDKSSTTSSYIETNPSASAPYNQPSQNTYEVQHPLPRIGQLPYSHSSTEQLSFNNPYHKSDDTAPLQQDPQLSGRRYEKSATDLPPPPKRVLPPNQCSCEVTDTSPPQYSLELERQFKPIMTSPSAPISQQASCVVSPTVPPAYSDVPSQQRGQPPLPYRIPTDDMIEKLADDEATQKGLRPGQEVIQEPKFKNNLMDFDISKFGAPPPRARLTKDEESRLSRERAEKQRLKAIKENSLMKARENNARQLSPYASSNPSASKVSLATETPASTSDPVLKQKSLQVPEITKFSPPSSISVVKGLDSTSGRTSFSEGATLSQNSVLHTEFPSGPKGFGLPDISKYQPSQAVPQPQDVSSDDISSVKSFHTAPGTPSFGSFPESDKVTPDLFSSAEKNCTDTLRSEDLLNRAPCPLPVKKNAPPKPLKNQHASDAALELERQNFTASSYHASALKPHSEYFNIHLKTVPPPKPAKLSEDSLSELAMLKKKKAPPKPVKKPTVDSTAKGDHIRELQARLGKLDFQ